MAVRNFWVKLLCIEQKVPKVERARKEDRDRLKRRDMDVLREEMKVAIVREVHEMQKLTAVAKKRRERK